MKNIINVTPHVIRFQNAGNVVYEVEPCGVLVNARPIEEGAGLRLFCGYQPSECQTEHYGHCENCGYAVELVRTRFVATPEEEEKLAVLEAENSGAIIVGSIIAAQAFPGRVLAMVPAPGFERVPPDQKKMRDDKFTTF